jgi:glycosyltransferase involved in cell wall biosynthesis
MLERDEIELWLVGGGKRLPEMQALAARLGISDRVTFWGRRSDVARLLAESDIFVLPSTTESCPHALLEALAVGLPVVATDVGGVSEIVSDRVNGLLIPAADPAAICGAIRELRRDRSLYERLTTNGVRGIRQSYCASLTARRFEQLYEDLAVRT